MENKGNFKVLFTEEQIQKRIKELSEELNSFYRDEEVCAICVLKGAVLFASDLIRYLKMPLKLEFIRLSSYHGGKVSTGKINAVDISLPDLNGKNVLILEDIIDTGHTAKFLLDFIKMNFHTKSTKFCSLLDKRIKRQVEVNADFCGFEVGDNFLVGYGFDDNGYYRNLRDIGEFCV